MYKMPTQTLPVYNKSKIDTTVLTARMNLDSFKSFDFEDDAIYCPVISKDSRESSLSRSSTPTSDASSYSVTPEKTHSVNSKSISEYTSPSFKFSTLSQKSLNSYGQNNHTLQKQHRQTYQNYGYNRKKVEYGNPYNNMNPISANNMRYPNQDFNNYNNW